LKEKTFVLLVSQGDRVQRLSAMLPPSLGREVASTESEITEIANARQPAAVVVDWDHVEKETARAAMRVQNGHGHIPTLMIVGEEGALRQISQGLDEGDDVMRDPVGPHELGLRLMAHLDRLGRIRAPLSSGRQGRLVVFTSAKGGVGTSSLAVNAAVVAGQLTRKSVLLIDGDLSAGAHDMLLGIPGQGEFYERIAAGEPIDVGGLRESLVAGPGHVKSLLSPSDPELSERVTAEKFGMILTHARSLADIVVADCGDPYGDRSLTAFELADEVVVVCVPEMSVMRNTLKLLELGSKLGFAGKIRILVNRADTAYRLSEVEAALGKKIIGAIPSLGQAMLRAANAGTPLLSSQPNHSSRREWERVANELLHGRTGPAVTEATRAS
jgi:pilus assembly protein CpaE